MQDRYERNIPALSEAECHLLRSKRVLVVGCGGLGGHIIDMLTRLGIGFLRVVDGDVFEPSNLNRQLLCSTAVMGTSKANAAVAHIRQVNPDVNAEPAAFFMTEDNVRDLIAGCDVVMDALDNIPGRRILAAACAQAGIPYIYGAIQGWVAQAAISMPGDGVIEKLFPQDTVIRDKSVLSFTPALCAAMQVSLCVKLLTGRNVQSGTLHYADLLFEEYEQVCLR